MKVHLVVGARPNFMKIAPLYKELLRKGDVFKPELIHTGQHYDEKMSKLFFEDLRMPKPDVYLAVGSGNHGSQTAKIMERYEEYLLSGGKPELVVVAGDVNSTFACAYVAKKHHISVAHLEAGLRSFDNDMPEEINRILTDRISDLLLTPSLDGNDNLIKEGADPKRIKFVGNIMMDSIVEHEKQAKASSILHDLGLEEKQPYILVTLHRPSNVDSFDGLSIILKAFRDLSSETKIVFPMHPRTRNNITRLQLDYLVSGNSNLLITDPIGYLDFMKLQMHAALILTDSGGIQEESTFFGIPCLTLRENTERPVTITEGTNKLVKLDTHCIVSEAESVLEGDRKTGSIPMYWDGCTAQRVVKEFREFFDK